MKRILQVAGCILLTMSIGGLSGFATIAGVNGWYKTLQKPGFNPPNSIFGPVWSLLYLLMGISLALILGQEKSKERSNSIRAFALQMLLNFFWSVIFFNLHAVGWALIEIILMWLSILTMIILFYRVNKPAALLQIPYICWVSFASILNVAIFHLN
jgi:tryptophan-rich sensory protein